VTRGGASWNRTSDLSIIREVKGFPLRPRGSRPVPVCPVTVRPRGRPETRRDGAGHVGTQLLGRSWDRPELTSYAMRRVLASGTSLSTSNTIRFEQMNPAPNPSNAVESAFLDGEMWRAGNQGDLDLRSVREEIPGFATVEWPSANVP